MTRETPDLRQMAGHHCCSGCDASGHCTHGTETWYEGYDRGVRNTTEIRAALAATPEPTPAAQSDVRWPSPDDAEAIHQLTLVLWGMDFHPPNAEEVAHRILGRLAAAYAALTATPSEATDG